MRLFSKFPTIRERNKPLFRKGEGLAIPKPKRRTSWLGPARYSLRSMYDGIRGNLPSPSAYTKPFIDNIRSMRNKPKPKINSEDKFILGEHKTKPQEYPNLDIKLKNIEEREIFEDFRAGYSNKSGDTNSHKEQKAPPQHSSAKIMKHSFVYFTSIVAAGVGVGIYEPQIKNIFTQLNNKVTYATQEVKSKVQSTYEQLSSAKTLAQRLGQTPQVKVETSTSPQEYATTQTQSIPAVPSIPAPLSQATSEAVAPYKVPKTIEDKVASLGAKEEKVSEEKTYVTHKAQRGGNSTKIILKYHFHDQKFGDLVTNVTYLNELSPNQKLQEGYEVRIPISYRGGATRLVVRYTRDGETLTELLSRELNNRINKFFAKPNNLNGDENGDGVNGDKIIAGKEYKVAYDDEGELEPIDTKPVQIPQKPMASRYEQAPQKVEPKKAEKTAMGQLENKIKNVAYVPNSLNNDLMELDPELRYYTLKSAKYSPRVAV